MRHKKRACDDLLNHDSLKIPEIKLLHFFMLTRAEIGQNGSASFSNKIEIEWESISWESYEVFWAASNLRTNFKKPDECMKYEIWY